MELSLSTSTRFGRAVRGTVRATVFSLGVVVVLFGGHALADAVAPEPQGVAAPCPEVLPTVDPGYGCVTDTGYLVAWTTEQAATLCAAVYPGDMDCVAATSRWITE